MGRRRKSLPADPVQATVEDLSHDGRGVAKVDGKATFLHGALPGETVMFRYRARRKSHDEGETVEVLQASPDRVEARCPHFGVCGGCVLQHMDPDAQIEAKRKVLEENLRRIGNVEPEHWLQPLVADRWGYRRKARLSVKNVPKKGKVLVGFREKNGRYVADLLECHVLVPDVGLKLEALSELIGRLDARDQIPQLEVAAGDDRTLLVLRHLEPLSASDIEILRQYQRDSGLQILLQSKGPDTIHALDGASWALHFEVPEEQLRFEFTPVNFVQVNASLNQRMIRLARELLEVSREDRILDLFCGLGNFTLPLARHARELVGVEAAPDLVELARRNAQTNGIDNAQFHVADLSEDHNSASWLAGGFDKVLLDPPRSGAREILEPLSQLGASRIVYISCHPGSLARDAGVLVNELGYRLVSAGVMDMFPHTAHVESVAVFEAGSGH